MAAIITLIEGGDREVQEEVTTVAQQVNMALKTGKPSSSSLGKTGASFSVPAKNVKEITEPVR